MFYGPLSTQKSQGQRNAKRGILKSLSLHLKQQDCVAITLTSTIQAKAGQDEWAWRRGAGLKQAAGRRDSDGKLRLHMLAKPSFRGVFFSVVVAVKMTEQGKKVTSLALVPG